MLVLLSGGCDRPRGTPWVEPVLHGLGTPYSGLSGLEVHVFNTGTMRIPAAVIHRGASLFDTREIDIPAYVIKHPTEGLVVFDSGLRPLVEGKHSDKMLVGALESEEGQDLPAQMREAGFDPGDVRYLVLSHLHFDHTGAIGAFDKAEVVVTAPELAAARDPVWWSTGFFRAEDFELGSRLKQIRFAGTKPLATFDGHYDLLGDGSLRLVDLAGHTPGSQGLLVSVSTHPVLLTGDASYVEASWRYGARPLLAHDMDAWWLVSWKIKKFSQLMPLLIVLPGHDLKAARRNESPSVVYHPFEEADADDGDSDPH